MSFIPPKDWKRALWRAPLHIAASIPVAAASLIVPPVGKKYVGWRIKAEADDLAQGRDSEEKTQIDLYSQTALVRAALKLYGIKE